MKGHRKKFNVANKFFRTFHDGRIFICDICLKTFINGSELREHKMFYKSKRHYVLETPTKKEHFNSDNLQHLEKLESFQIFRRLLKNGLKPKLELHLSGKLPTLHKHNFENVDLTNMLSVKVGNSIKQKSETNLTDETSRSFKFCCDVCGKRFQSKAVLRIHLYSHFGIKAFKCPKCGLCLSQKGGLTVHMRIHTGEKPFSCEVCGMRFTQPVSREHMSKHTGERLHKCDICSAEFGSKTVLKTHKIAKHTLLRPFQCDICKKTFADKHYMTKHRTIHRDVKPYPCTKCEKSFITKSNLRRHLEIHTVRKSHECTVCSKIYNNSSSLLYHMTTHSKEPRYLCGICNQQLATKQNLQKHMKLHVMAIQDKKHAEILSKKKHFNEIRSSKSKLDLKHMEIQRRKQRDKTQNIS